MEENKDLEIMRQLIEKKKQKSSSQSGMKRGPEGRYGETPGNKKTKKGGLSPK